MGVPSFYRWLVNKYPKVVVRAKEDVDTNMFDNLYLDMNGIIHPCFHPGDHNNSSQPTTIEEVMKNIFEYIDRLVTIVRPRKLLYLAIDGVAPRAKMNQQRSRRFRTAQDNAEREEEEERLRKQFENEGKLVLPKQESEISDSNIITPGTEFMHELSKALESYISSRMTSNSLWRDIMVILSNASVPGEGEHKIMSYIRKQRCLPEYDPNTSHCLYGLDADLIMLALSTHEPHFSILREDVLIQEQQPQIAIKPFEFLHIWLLREYLELDLKIEDPPKSYSYDFERIIDDFIFICFFAGNDFLPHMPTLEIHEGAIDLLMSVYKKEFNKLGGYLVDMSRVGEKKAAYVKLSRVEKFILMVGSHEEKIFKKRSEIRERNLRRLISDAKEEQEKEACFSDNDNENSSDCALVIKKANVPASSSEILQNTKDLKEEVNKCIRMKSDLFKSGDFRKDKINLGSAGWRERYYKEKFSVEGSTDIEAKRKDIVQKYTGGLLWVLQYYFSGVPSWTWFYPYYYGPFASDLKGMSQVTVNFERGVPFLPFDQLLSVLPPSSAHALPNAYAQLMVDEKSSILDFYPLDFEVDTEGKRFTWQGICKLPFIEEKRLLAVTSELKNKLSENEAIRNSVLVDTLFVRNTTKLAEKICSLSREPNSISIDTSISDGIGGIISLCRGIKICDNIQQDDVLCLCFEMPVSSCHIPRLLSGVELPEKTISEDDIMETILWHERQRQSQFDSSRSGNSDWNAAKCSPNATTQDRRSFTSNLSSEVIHKGAAGIGRGSGRGRQSNSINIKRTDMDQQLEGQGSYHVTAMRDTRSWWPDVHRQLRISESNQSARPNGGAQFFGAFENGLTNVCYQGSQSGTTPYGRGRGRLQHDLTNQSNNVSYQRSQSGTVPYGRGRGRLQHGSNNANSWSSSNNISLRPQWSGAKAWQVKDQDR